MSAPSITSDAENSRVHAMSARVPGAWGSNGHPFWTYGPWVGASRSSSGDGQWRWVSDEPWGFTAWHPGQPDSTTQHFVSFGGGGPSVASWADTFVDEPVRSYVVEWDADCNGDGVVDKGQILSGVLIDTDLNGIPDTCQAPTCRDADLYSNGRIDGADLAALLTEWGAAGPTTRADFDRDGRVDGADLGFLLANWGPCPN